MRDEPLIFTFFNEVGIVSQLAQAYLNRHLPEGLHYSHFATLNHLDRVGNGRTPQSIASAMQVAKPTMTHTLGVLERRALVEIKANPRDGRSKQVFLTEAGRSFLKTAIADVSAGIASIASHLDRDEISAAIPLLRSVRKALDEERASLPRGY